MGGTVNSDAVIIVTVMKFVIPSLEIVANVRMDFRMPNVMNVSSFLYQSYFAFSVRDMIGKKIDITSCI